MQQEKGSLYQFLYHLSKLVQFLADFTHNKISFNNENRKVNLLHANNTKNSQTAADSTDL